MEVPKEATSKGRLDLEIKIHGEVNAAAAIVELWGTGPTQAVGSFDAVSGIWPDLKGTLLDAQYDGDPNAEVRLVTGNDEKTVAVSKTDAAGSFSFAKKVANQAAHAGRPKLVATVGGMRMEKELDPLDLAFEPVHYRPIPSKVAGLSNPVLSLDGTWQINPGGKAWADIQVPGQWKQQGFEIPRDRTVAMAKEFSIPKQWGGKRIFVRFDAVHAGAHYSLNGTPIGQSENLFTPVEFEITREAKVGETNRLELQMVVDTPSEALSYSSNYAFHSLGGIDRSVRVFALPEIMLRDLNLTVDLDENYRDAQVEIRSTLDSGETAPVGDVALDLRLTDPNGKIVPPAPQRIDVGSLSQGLTPVNSTVSVLNPEKWNAEKP